MKKQPRHDGLTYENFFTEMTAKYPNVIKMFGTFIDDYKETVRWRHIFNEHYSPSPKYHQLPFAMQFGIFLDFVEQFGEDKIFMFEITRNPHLSTVFLGNESKIDFMIDFFKSIEQDFLPKTNVGPFPD